MIPFEAHFCRPSVKLHDIILNNLLPSSAKRSVMSHTDHHVTSNFGFFTVLFSMFEHSSKSIGRARTGDFRRQSVHCAYLHKGKPVEKCEGCKKYYEKKVGKVNHYIYLKAWRQEWVLANMSYARGTSQHDVEAGRDVRDNSNVSS
jgi:hypothetical protein